ncbi:hypothetical protein [Streptococcus pneumoniae]|uniref:hypothetical protein n=1 Tax=Streptococcus pneumoniae TaxID=1313 RepID=UPI00186B04A8|nr:hypothetical protein [Streptococcus pneumoniae]
MRLQIELTKSAQNTVLRLPDKTDEVSSKHRFKVVDRTDEVSNIYLRQGEADLV